MTKRPSIGQAAAIPVGVLLLIHLTILPLFLHSGENAVLFVANLAAVLYGVLYHRIYSHLRFASYLAGYLCFFIIIALTPSATPLVSLFILLYASLFRIPRLLFHFLLFVLCVELLPEYFLQVYPLSALLLELLHHSFVAADQRLVGWSFLVGFILIGGILIPVSGLVFGSSPQTLTVTLGDTTVTNALGTSVLTATITTLVTLLLGVPLAYAMARSHFWGREVLASLIDLPILIPQSVAGVAILAALGPKTTFGRFLSSNLGLSLPSSLLGIVVAQLFVSAPFLIRAAMAAFAKVDRRLEYVSRSLGASQLRTFFSVSLPLALPGIFAGCILTWSRAISEAGTVMLIAYQPFTISTLVQDRFNQFGTNEAAPVAALLVIICLFVFLILNLMKYLPLWQAMPEAGSSRR